MTVTEYRQTKATLQAAYVGREHTDAYRSALTNLANQYGARVVRLVGNRYRLTLLRGRK